MNIFLNEILTSYICKNSFAFQYDILTKDEVKYLNFFEILRICTCNNKIYYFGKLKELNKKQIELFKPFVSRHSLEMLVHKNILEKNSNLILYMILNEINNYEKMQKKERRPMRSVDADIVNEKVKKLYKSIKQLDILPSKIFKNENDDLIQIAIINTKFEFDLKQIKKLKESASIADSFFIMGLFNWENGEDEDIHGIKIIFNIEKEI